MRIRLTFRRPDGSRANVQIVADGTATAGDVAAALAAGEDGRTDPGRGDLTLRLLGSRGEGATLAPATPVLEAGLRSGATVELAHAAAAGKADRGSVGALLRVVNGPNSGLEVQLPIGSSDLGRSHDCDVRVNDPLVSKRHARINVGDRVDIVDTNSANGVVIGGVRVARATLGNGDLVTVGATTFTVSQLQTSTGEATSDVAFVRPPRVLERPRSESMALPDAPRAPRASFFPWLAMMAPLLMGTVMFAFNRTPQAVLFIMMSPVMMAGSFFGQKVDARRQLRLDLATFEKDLERVTTEVRHAHDREREQSLNVHPSVAQCVQAAASLSPVLWSRRPEHPEFLQTRLGIGAVEPKCIVERPKRVGVPECVDKVVAAHQSLLTLRDAPVVADLRSVGGIGLSGDRGPVDDVARALVAQIAILHSPAEVILCVLTSSAGRQRWSWLEWLPHVASPHSPVSQHLVADAISGTSLLGQIEDVIDVRRRTSGATTAARGPLVKDEDRPQPPLPAVVVIVDESLVDRGRLTRVAERGPDFGVFVVWVATSRHVIPGACRTFVDIGSANNPVAGMVRTEKTLNPLHCEGLDLATAAQVARQLAPVTDSGAPTDDDSDVPRSVPLVALYDAASPDDPEAVLAGWRENGSLTVRDGTPAPAVDRPSGLRALVGHTGSEKFALDLRTQGPHALVGGTTGAGKSEFLQAWVLGLARAYSPDRVAFLFVDYKGGSAFARCVDLPHTVGMVTDLSPYLVQRALKSLRAELRFREHLLNAKGKKDLIDLERTGDIECPPSLIIVVDEFAALVGEVPEFVDGVVDVAQRGRSLGLHLILATQRPAGVIKDNLRANTNLRIALRMADESDSTDVLGTPMAAHFDPGTPGRGAAKTGPGRIMQFQSAYPGSRTAATPQAPPIQVSTLDFGAGRNWTPPAVKSAPAPVATDLDRMTASIAAAAQLGGVPAPRKPWLDSLADIYNLRLLTTQRSDQALVLGVLDDPENQRQIEEHFRPDVDGNILFYGATGSGKSAALRTLAAAAAILPRGGVIHVYALDFASGALASLETLPHVGAVIRGDDEERIRRLIRRLAAVVDERTQRFSEVRAATLKDYRELAGAPNEPRILVLVDGFGTFRSEYEGSIHLDAVYNAFLKIVGEGRALGIHVAMTADRPNAVPTTVAASFLRRVVLRQADEDAYLALGVPRDILTPASPPGRALQSDKPQELQLAIFGGERSVAVQARLLEELAQTVDHKLSVRPEPVRALPALITAAQVPASVAGRPVLGVSDESLQPIGFDPSGPILVAGGPQAGKTSALRWFAESLHRAYPRAELFHFSHRKSPLSGLALWRESPRDLEQSRDLASRLAARLTSPPPDTGPTALVIIENLPEFVDGALDGPLRELVVLAKKHGHPLVADGDTAEWAKYSDLMRELRSARRGLVLRPSTDDADNLLNTPTPRTRPADFPPGRGYWIAAGKSVKVQIPVVE